MLFRWLLLMSLALGPVAAAGASEVLDRVVASVNGHVILLSEWNDELRFEGFTSGRKPSELSWQEKKAVLDRLIDQELVAEQIPAADSTAVTSGEVERQIAALKADYLREHASESWPMAISKYQLTDRLIENHVRKEVEELEFVNARFRSSIQVSEAEIANYYQEQLLPKLPSADPVSLAEATAKIREILAQSKVNQMLSLWLDTLRSQAQIRILSPNSDSAAQVPGP
jgi:peptidyl-prolyl cis-trans isomerase SurA